MLHLDYRDTRPIYEQITENFKNQITAGVLQNGDQLPSIRELASQLTINPNTIQRAYRELEVQGWLTSIPGKGCFVSYQPVCADPADLFSAFDNAAAELMQAGIPVDTLIGRLQQGGNHYA